MLNFRSIAVIQPIHKYFFVVVMILVCGCKTASKEIPDNAKATKIFAKAREMSTLDEYAAAYNMVDTFLATKPTLSKENLYHKYYFLYGYYSDFKNNPKQSELYNDSLFAVATDLYKNDKKKLLYAYIARVGMYTRYKKYDEAVKYLTEAKFIIEGYLQTCDMSIIYTNFGNIRYLQKNFSLATQYYKMSLAARETCTNGSDVNIIIDKEAIIDNIALAYEKAGKIDSAIYFYKSAIAMAENKLLQKDSNIKYNFYTSMAIVYGNLGGAFLKINELDSAKKYLEKSIVINYGKKGFVEDAQLTEIKLAYLHLKQKNYYALNNHLKHLDEMAKIYPFSEAEKRLRLLRHDIAIANNNTVEAYSHFKRYTFLKDSIELSESKVNGIDVISTFDNIENTKLLDALRKKNQFKTFTIGFSLLLILSAIVIIILIYKNNLSSKESIKQLEILNKQIANDNIQITESFSALEQSHEENSRMMRIVAHDLRNPVGAMISLASLLKSDEDTNTEQAEILAMISKSGSDALSIISDLLYVKQALTVMKKEPVEMDTLLQYCVNILQYKAEEKKQTISASLFPILIEVNREKIWRVISNLITNAIKFSPSGATILVGMKKNDKFLTVFIKDNGLGIPEHLKHGIFNMYTDSSRQGTSGEASFGMGLAISRQIIQAHQGKIWFDSEVNKGTTFYFELPLS